MRLIRMLVLVLLVSIAGYYFLENSFAPGQAIDNFSEVFEQKKNMLKTKQVPEKRTAIPLDGDLFQWVGKKVKDVTEAFGEPVRKDRSAYGYNWLVYKNDNKQYIQFGIVDNTVQSIYAIGDNLSLEPIKIGQNYESIKNEFSFKNEVTYSKRFSSYISRLSDEELQTRPLVKITDDVFMQLYFDTFTEKLSSVRVMSADILLLHRPYEMEYRGDLPEQPNMSDEEWDIVEQGMEQQIFDVTNVMRNYYGKTPLSPDEKVSEVAYSHSKDMHKNNYFSHYGMDGAGLKERLAAKEVFYQAAGENIAAQYPDAPSAMHGWLNSEGHREALLKDDYTDIGVGVYRFYYTQNFLKKK